MTPIPPKSINIWALVCFEYKKVEIDTKLTNSNPSRKLLIIRKYFFFDRVIRSLEFSNSVNSSKLACLGLFLI